LVFNFTFVPELNPPMNITASTVAYTFVLSLFITCQKATRLPDPLAAGWKGKAVCELVSEDDKLRVLRCTFAPGVGHEKHYHNANFGYTIAGSRFQIRDTTGVREVDLVTGSSFTSEGTNWHEVLNIGDSTAVFLIIEPK
jgi:quercetin dioxygenase-like cupin family protein